VSYLGSTEGKAEDVVGNIEISSEARRIGEIVRRIRSVSLGCLVASDPLAIEIVNRHAQLISNRGFKVGRW
jgi:hypothetical protein